MKSWSNTLLVLALAGSAAPAFAQPAAAPNPAQVERGRAAYVVKGCYECHGYAGQGSIQSGPTLAGLGLSYDAIDAYIRNPAGQMPPYSKKILGADDLRDIAAYVESLGGAPAALAPVPLDPASK